MTPYYEDDHCQIYHGDCRDIIPTLSFDVVVTDPPYGIDANTDYTRLEGSKPFATGIKEIGKKHNPVHGDDEPFDPAMFGDTPAAMFGVNHYAARVPESCTWHVWDKREELASNMLADAEMWATTWGSGPTRIFRHKWLGYFRPKGRKGDGFDHPTAKPLALMRYIIGEPRTPPGVILDPYMGSGTTLRAAKDLGRKSIGIELEEKYCEVAVARLAQEVLDFG
jgi:site-specific DNA-methyltransferase (adenine-specific)